MNSKRLHIALALVVTVFFFKAHSQCSFTDLSLQEACDPVGPGFEAAVDLTFTLTALCEVEEVCFSRVGDGLLECTDIQALQLGNGDTYHLSLPGAGIYQIWATTDGSSSPVEQISINCFDESFDCNNEYAINYNPIGGNPSEQACLYDEYICDCAGTSHTIGVLSYLGDAEYETGGGGKLWNAQQVDFSCNVWGFDCGDGGINYDPYGVCTGDLPPNNGCSSPGCAPLVLAITQGDCVVSENGILPTMDIQFSINDGCTATELCYTVNSSEEICLDLSGNGGYANGEVYQFLGAQPNGVYQFQFFTGAGAVSPLFTFEVTEECSPVNTICDCDGNTWPDSFTSYLGDGQLNNGVNPVDGYYINFDCMTWGVDCGEGSGSGDPFNVCLGNLPQSNGCEDFTFGCTYILSCNYDSSAQIDDGSCDYSCYGCTDSQACNFDITATLDDDSCDYSCIGCTDEIACNNNETATIDNGSCTYAEPFTNCAGQCINDADGDGVCDELEVPGCTYS